MNLKEGKGQGGPGSDAVLKVTIQGDAVIDGMTAFLFTVDDYEVSLPGVGTHALPVRPGRRSLRVYSRSLWRYGDVELVLYIAPGQTIDLYYAPPYHPYAPGAMGVVAQKRKGLGAVVGSALVVVIVVFVLGVLMPTLETIGFLR